MNYYELVFTVVDPEGFVKDLLIASLSEIGFDTFEDTESGFKAYIQAEQFNEHLVSEQLSDYKDQFNFSYETNLIPHKNWNEVWENNFEPVIVADKLYIRATFHPARAEFPMEIVIDPKMAFGTGHHETTYLMSEFLLQTEVEGKKVLDMGCGSGILAILASKLGAEDLLAVDIDPICVSSSIENAQLNEVDNMKTGLGDIDQVNDTGFDLILANINRNILLNHMSHYAAMLADEGELIMSGFYETPDLAIIQEEAAKYDLKYISHYTRNNWVAAKFVK
ncbi:50S ribosomal protein L11 methyltransferase [Solitalea canadensis]|uniref:Ribosomal protein L11 methyltransferase n=1 Tax=Solitalea canadensis (strain ATCC 29591 / DSM 3403 / JCM 21819 / LMG 8368 / NBRC 15130 / NCIMB 12057 / USAM 9D) TaxID=929556 RepID=H8KPK9_SOLCM|nr:50S ribosomal protein L11 methyltransferase [Solitalea canadensis]AFD05907.1 ribosomal protein L11 methylase [Solitalea canadensis DSM 3403]